MTDDALLAVLAEIRDEIQALRSALEQRYPPRRTPSRRKDTDDALIAILLHAIDAAIGARDFTCSDLLRHAEQVADAGQLRDAISAALPEPNPRKLGRLLARIEGRAIGGLEVHLFTRKDRMGAVWKIVAASLRV